MDKIISKEKLIDGHIDEQKNIMKKSCHVAQECLSGLEQSNINVSEVLRHISAAREDVSGAQMTVEELKEWVSELGKKLQII